MVLPGHLPALALCNAGLAPSLLQHPCSWGALLLLQRCSTLLLGSRCSHSARAPSFSAGSGSEGPISATALEEAGPSTSTTASAAGRAGSTANAWLLSRVFSSTRPAMLLQAAPAAISAWPAAAVLVRHLHSASSPPHATAAGSSDSRKAAAAPPKRPPDRSSGDRSKRKGKGRQGDAGVGTQPGTPHHHQQQQNQQQQQGRHAQPMSKSTAVSKKQLTLMLKHAETPQQLLQLLQQHKLQGGVLDAIHIATACHHLGEMCQADAAVAGTAAARELLQQLDQLLLSVRGHLKAWGLSNIIWACAYTKHAAPAAQLLPDFMQPKILSGADSRGVANVLWALATLKQQVPPQQVDQLVGALVGFVAASGAATPQNISNSLWALGKMGHQVPEQQLGVLLAELAAQSRSAKPQELANSLWGVAKLGQRVQKSQQLQQLFAAFISQRSKGDTQALANFLWAVSELGQQVQAEQLEQLLVAFVKQLHRANPQHVSNMLLACARLRHVPVQLMAPLQQPEAMQRFLAAANAQDLGNTAWACGMLEHNCELLLGGLLQQAVKLQQESGRFVCQDLCNLCWAVAVLDMRQHVPAVLQLAQASSNVWGAAAPEDLQQLYQVHLWLLDHSLAPAEGAKGPGLLQVLSQQQLDECRRSWQDQVAHRAAATPSLLQQQVFAALQQLPGWQVLPQQEVVTGDSNFSIDMTAVTAAGVRLAVEVDGPSHFVRVGGSWEVEGPTQYRNRALAARGYTVVIIPGWEWRQLKGAGQQQQYLAQKLRAAAVLSKQLPQPP